MRWGDQVSDRFDRHSRRWLTVGCLAAIVLALTGTGCAAAPAPHHGTAVQPTVVTQQPTSGSGGRHGGGDAPATTSRPNDWPAAVPLPPGQLYGSSTGPGRWSIQLIVDGSAAQVLRAAVTFYRAHGFHSVSDVVLDNGSYRLSVGAENRDHSQVKSFLLIVLTTA
jgi:hypothetical protein